MTQDGFLDGCERHRYKVHGGKGGVESFRGGDVFNDCHEKSMEITLVHISCRPGTESKFVKATLKNQAGVLANEPDAIRFDILQQEDDPTKFVLFEVDEWKFVKFYELKLVT